MARRQNHWTGVTRLECFCPASHADAPAVAGRQAREIIFGAGRDQVVAAHRQKVQKWLRDLAANRMQPAILRPRPAITIAIKPRHGRLTAAFQFTTQNIRRHDPSVPQPHPGSSAWVADGTERKRRLPHFERGKLVFSAVRLLLNSVPCLLNNNRPRRRTTNPNAK